MAQTQHKKWWLYVLKLESDKWYVGITSKTPKERFWQHKNGYLAARWTKKYKPLSIYDTKDLGVCTIEQAQLYEGRVTRKYMEEYGDNNVRGGDLTDDVEYIRRFGWIFTKDNWDIVTHVTLLALIMVALVLDKFQWDVRVLLGIVVWVLVLQLWFSWRARKREIKSTN